LKVFTHILQKVRSPHNLSGGNFVDVQQHKSPNHWKRAMTPAIMWVPTKGNFCAEFFKVITAEIKPPVLPRNCPSGGKILEEAMTQLYFGIWYAV